MKTLLIFLIVCLTTTFIKSQSIVITVTSPNGGENWQVGSSHDITWTDYNSTSVKIEYTDNYTGSNTQWINITTINNPRIFSFSWTIPNTQSANCKVRISNGINTDESDNVFTITKITVTSPIQGNYWHVGYSYNITWTSSDVDNVNIEYSTNNGTNWTSIVSNTPSDGSYSWSVPYTPSKLCKIRISDASNSSISDESGVFQITQPKITITSPNGGENWQVGSSHDITWTNTFVYETWIKIEYTTNNGSNWIGIDSWTVQDSPYNWTIPNAPSKNCKVRIISSDASANDQSNNVFTISSPPKITVISPNGGENWQAGSSHNITWISTNVSNVKIEYSTNNGTNWTIIVSSTSSDGSYSWTIPNTSSTNCKVRISDAANSSVNDQSNIVFTISSPPKVTVTSPNGGENWQVGSSHDITWTSTSVSNVKIEYSTNNGTNWTNVVSSISSDGSYSWKIPNTPSTNCKVRVSDASNSSVNDQSNNVFTISTKPTPTITVTSPNGGENWQVGSSHDITWTSTSVTNVKIEYSTNNGTNWTSIISSTSSDGSYSWTIPNTQSTSCKVRISDASNSSVNDQSNNVFTISSQPNPKIIVTSPNGGENWQIGSSYNITWTSNDVSNVKIEYSTNNGSDWISLVSSTISDGSYNWTIPNTPSTSCKVKIFDASNSSVNDLSDNLFTISEQLFTRLTSAPFTGVCNGSAVWGDYDNDGDLDILLTGHTESSCIAKVYRNDGNNIFTEQKDILLIGVWGSWGDYDNDGDLDILLTGWTGSSSVTKIYRNNGDNTFTDQTSISLLGVSEGSVTWCDYDNDGDLDILLTGISVSSGNISKIYRNNGNNSFIEQASISLTGVGNGSSAVWGDYNNDGYMDILLTGYTGNNYVSKVYKNNGNNNFIEQTSISLTDVSNSSAEWGDYDNDGDLDILLSGYTGSGYISKIYRNNGNNSFTEQTSISLTGVGNDTDGKASAIWGDYDNDGYLDILLTGNTGTGYISKIYRNNGDNSFTEQNSISITGICKSSAAWGDYDNDGDLDILLTGYSESGLISTIYKNNSDKPNTLPTVPGKLVSSVDGQNVTLSWDKSTDNETPQNGLKYNLVIGTTLDGVDVLSPMSDTSNGCRRIISNGNTNHNNNWTIKGLQGGVYYWRVQAIDNTFAGSPFSVEKSFTIIPATNSKKSAQFSSAGDYIEVPHSSSLALTEFTIEFWLKVEGLGDANAAGGEQTILDKRGDNNTGFNFRLVGTKFPVSLFTIALPGDVSAINAINQNVWYHIAVTQDKTKLKLYLNGEIVEERSNTYASGTQTPLRIGEFLGYPGTYLGLHGEIDELCIWNNACSQDEIKSGMHKKLNGAEEGLAACWNFDNKFGATIPDLSPNGNNATVNGNVKLVDTDELYTAVDETKKTIPEENFLSQNYPNPFNPTTRIEFQVKEPCFVTLKIYNVLGNEVATIVKEQLPTGYYKYHWDGNGMASGVYFYKLQAGNYSAVRKMLLMK